MKVMVFIVLIWAVFGMPFAQKCDPEDKSSWEWAFNFPQEAQKGSAIVISRDSLLNPENVRSDGDFAQWMAQHAIPIILMTDMVGQSFSEFRVWRNSCDGRVVIDPGPIFHDPVRGLDPSSMPIEGTEGLIAVPRQSTKKKIIAGAMATAPIFGYLLGGWPGFIATGAVNAVNPWLRPDFVLVNSKGEIIKPKSSTTQPGLGQATGQSVNTEDQKRSPKVERTQHWDSARNRWVFAMRKD